MNGAQAKAGAAGLILMTLCVGQFLMMLDSSVMNVSIATVAKDVDTTVTGIQTAITLYTLVPGIRSQRPDGRQRLIAYLVANFDELVYV